MNHFEIIPALPFEQYEGESGFEQERGRVSARPRPPARGAPPPRLRPQRRPPLRPKPRPWPRPRPRPLPWPPSAGAGYGLPWVVERAAALSPSGDAPSGGPGADDERWRCVQACFSRAPSSAAPAPEPSAAPAPATADTGSDAPEGGGSAASAPEPGQEEFEYGYEYEGEFEVAPGLLTLPAAIADPRAAGPGIYTLFKEGRRVYVGRAKELRRRLQQHLLCLTHLKLKVSRFHVKLTPLRGAPPAHSSRVESVVIDRFGRASQGGQLANVKSREF